MTDNKEVKMVALALAAILAFFLSLFISETTSNAFRSNQAMVCYEQQTKTTIDLKCSKIGKRNDD